MMRAACISLFCALVIAPAAFAQAPYRGGYSYGDGYSGSYDNLFDDAQDQPRPDLSDMSKYNSANMWQKNEDGTYSYNKGSAKTQRSQRDEDYDSRVIRTDRLKKGVFVRNPDGTYTPVDELAGRPYPPDDEASIYGTLEQPGYGAGLPLPPNPKWRKNPDGTYTLLNAEELEAMEKAAVKPEEKPTAATTKPVQKPTAEDPKTHNAPGDNVDWFGKPLK